MGEHSWVPITMHSLHELTQASHHTLTGHRLRLRGVKPRPELHSQEPSPACWLQSPALLDTIWLTGIQSARGPSNMLASFLFWLRKRTENDFFYMPRPLWSFWMHAASPLHSSTNSKSHHKHTSLGTREVPTWITHEFMFRGMFLQDAAKKKKRSKILIQDHACVMWVWETLPTITASEESQNIGILKSLEKSCRKEAWLVSFNLAFPQLIWTWNVCVSLTRHKITTIYLPRNLFWETLITEYLKLAHANSLEKLPTSPTSVLWDMKLHH